MSTTPAPSSTNRHVDSIWPIWSVLDMTPEGRGTESAFPKLHYE